LLVRIMNTLKRVVGNGCKGVDSTSLTFGFVCNKEDWAAVFHLMSTITACTTLKSKQEMRAASYLIDSLGLPHHNDSQKDWDTLKTLCQIFAVTNPASNILDAGGGPHSPVLNALMASGYSNLYACDIANVSRMTGLFSSTIRFSRQNIEKTHYENNFFHVVTCLSVIEHGVDHGRFFAEMGRIIKDDGLLIITTDYWPEHVDCSNIYPYGADNPQMKVYDARDLERVVQTGRYFGFELSSPLALDVDEKAVRWDDVDREYTFVFMVMKRIKSGS
jgi:SAM-dependent methyltransferase